jgi:hypothetical protein
MRQGDEEIEDAQCVLFGLLLLLVTMMCVEVHVHVWWLAVEA